MYYSSFQEFLKFSNQGNVIPVYMEINAGPDTPVSAYLKIHKGDYGFLLESVEGQERIARYSFLGTEPALVFQSRGRNIEIFDPRRKKSIRRFIAHTHPLDEIRKIMSGFKRAPVNGLPRFFGGLVGFIGYDSARFFERIPDKNPDDLRLPDICLMLAKELLIFDHLYHRIKIVVNVILPRKNKPLTLAAKKKLFLAAARRIEETRKEFEREAGLGAKAGNQARWDKAASNFKKQEFKNIIKAAKNYIKKGDIIQVVLSQRFKIRMRRPAFAVYRNLRSLNPSPYMYFLQFKGFNIIGSSPEMLVRCEGGVIQTRPIAGTRPRGKTELEDKKLAAELLRDNKERAEHLMLVDLGRNDLGRVARAGKVALSEFMRVEKYSHVMHLVSEVKAKLDNSRFDIYDVLQAAFPAGTVSGSPKIRAMEIIDELENLRRGAYAGCVGYFSFSQNMDTCITIRTIVTKGGYGYIQAGAGIVADSVPEKEYQESVNKAKALIEAIRG
ncbi:MAG: anthranilate synthase component I [Candidatus Omnitrophota bacterium]|nr:anthranilate synthase component I [Candidatus Omnitrophota bacterium]